MWNRHEQVVELTPPQIGVGKGYVDRRWHKELELPSVLYASDRQ